MAVCVALMRTLAAGPVMVLAALWAQPALALEQDEWQLAGGISGALAHQAGGFDPGAGLALEAERGLTDLWAVRASLGFDAFRPSSERWRQDLTLGLGTAAAFDVLRTVPFVELGLVLAWPDLDADAGIATRAGLQAGVGAEYLLDRAWSLGGVVRGRALPLALAGPGGAGGLVVSASLRCARRF
jgi:hypothetical protein